MQETQIAARIHRFRGMVSISLHDGPTIDLTPEDAKALGLRLQECAFDCQAKPFRESQFQTSEFSFKGKV